MIKATILNKLKLLNIRNSWQVSIVKELSIRRGESANLEPLYRDSHKRMKAAEDPNAKKKFNKAIETLSVHGLIFKKNALSGIRYHLVKEIWESEDGIINSIESSTLLATQGRRVNINWRTILREVRKSLSAEKIKLPLKVTSVLVRFSLLKRCGWKLDDNSNLVAPKSISKKIAGPFEEQSDLFR